MSGSLSSPSPPPPRPSGPLAFKEHHTGSCCLPRAQGAPTPHSAPSALKRQRGHCLLGQGSLEPVLFPAGPPPAVGTGMPPRSALPDQRQAQTPPCRDPSSRQCGPLSPVHPQTAVATDSLRPEGLPTGARGVLSAQAHLVNAGLHPTLGPLSSGSYRFMWALDAPSGESPLVVAGAGSGSLIQTKGGVMPSVSLLAPMKLLSGAPSLHPRVEPSRIPTWPVFLSVWGLSPLWPLLP